MEAAGIEPASPSLEDDSHQQLAKTTSRTLAQTLARETNYDPDLVLLVKAWTTLPQAIRTGIVAMVTAASGRQLA